jgi:thioredoxin 2
MMTSAISTEIIQCPNCGAKNRVTAEQWQKTPVCGKCKTPLPTKREPLEVTDRNFDELVAQSSQPVLLDMWAPWCGPCRMIAPTIVQLANEFAGRARVAKLNTDENQSTASRFKISGIPTLLIFKGGREVDRIVGLAPADEIRRRLDAVVDG